MTILTEISCDSIFNEEKKMKITEVYSKQ